MATEAQILANRRNAQKSTGPRTNRLSSLICQRIMTSIMQNKPNLLYAQTDLSSVKTTNYEQITMNNANKKQTQSKPISNGGTYSSTG